MTDEKLREAIANVAGSLDQLQWTPSEVPAVPPSRRDFLVVLSAAESWARLEWRHRSSSPVAGDGTFDVVARFRGDSGQYARLETVRWRTGEWLIAVEGHGWARLVDDCDFIWLSGSLPPVPTDPLMNCYECGESLADKSPRCWCERRAR